MAQYLKAQLQQRGVSAFPRDWHLKGAATAQSLIGQGITPEMQRAVIDWALADAFWGRQVTTMAKVADLVPRWQLLQMAPAGRPVADTRAPPSRAHETWTANQRIIRAAWERAQSEGGQGP